MVGPGPTSMSEVTSLAKEFDSIREQLAFQGLWQDDTLVLIARDGLRVVFDAQGKLVRSPFFSHVGGPLAVFTPGIHACTFATRQQSIRASNDDMAQMFGPTLPCMTTPSKGMSACLVKDCGMLVTGRFVSELVAAATLVEKLCRIELFSSAIGTPVPLGRALCIAEHAVYRASYSRRQMKSSSEGGLTDNQARDRSTPTQSTAGPQAALRHQVIAFGRRLVDERLIQATWGNLSVRTDADHFLISPSGVDYYAVAPEEVALVSVADGSYEKSLRPSSERHMHQLIYQARPDIGAIVHTHSPNCAVFAACREDLLTEVLDYPCAPYAVSGSGALARNASRVMLGHDGCILANHGLVTCADTLEHAFARALEAEAAAGRRLGL